MNGSGAIGNRKTTFGKPAISLGAVIRIFLSIVGVALLALLLTILWASRWSKISRDALIEQYRLEDSRFIEVDGVELHVRDVGSGPVVLLLHGHAGNLRMFDDWTDALADAYRVISFDIPGYGLSGSDPGGDYSIDRVIDLAMGLMDELGIERFYAGGTSIGSISAFRMTSRHGERIPALILANAAGLPSDEAQRFMSFLNNAEVEYHGFEKAGHILPIEAGEASAPSVRAFLDRLEQAPD